MYLSASIDCDASFAADYVRLMKYGDSLYRCKELKRAALVILRRLHLHSIHSESMTLCCSPVCGGHKASVDFQMRRKCLGAGSHVYHNEEAGAQPGLLGAGAAAHEQATRHRAQHKDAARLRLPQRGQEQLHEQCASALLPWLQMVLFAFSSFNPHSFSLKSLSPLPWQVCDDGVVVVVQRSLAQMWMCSRMRSPQSRCLWGTWTTATSGGRSSTHQASWTGPWKSATPSRCRSVCFFTRAQLSILLCTVAVDDAVHSQTRR